MAPDTNVIENLVTGIATLMLVAAVATMISKRLSKLPLTILLVFIGMALSGLSVRMPFLEPLATFELTPALVLFVFIPTLIFESSFKLDVRQVAGNIWPILTLAVPGLLLSTLIIGLTMVWLSGFDLLVALLLGAILSATDPVAVIAIFKQLGVPERLTILVEGESLFNDATSLVFATLLLGILMAGEFTTSTALGGFVTFVVVFFGGALVGWALALIVGETLGLIEEDPAIEITLTTILAYFSFIVAEHLFHVSGIMAVVAAGLTIGSWGRSKISPSTEDFMEQFWEYLAYLANALIFLMVGMQIDLVVLVNSLDLIASVVVAMLVSRAVVIFGLMPLVGKVPGSEAIGVPFQQVMYWGGLRGAIALAIVLSLPDFEHKDTLVAIVMGAVLFTLVVQGLSIESMVKWLGLDQLSIPDHLARLEGDRHARHEGLQRLASLQKNGNFSERVAGHLRAACEAQISGLEAELTTLYSGLSDAQTRRILIMRCLVREKARYHELFARGLINEWAYRELGHTIDVQMEDARHRNATPRPEFETSPAKALDLWLIRMLDVVPFMGWAAERLRTQRIVRDYDIAWGRYRGTGSVLSSFAELSGEGNIPANVVDEVRGIYEHLREAMKRELSEVADQFPEFVETFQEQLGQRMLLIAEHESVHHAASFGLIQPGVAQEILKSQNRRIRELKRDDIIACFEIEPEELLKKVPVFANMSSAQFASIALFLRPLTVPRGTEIIRQGEAGDSLFLIARGVARVMIEADGVVSHAATLFAGDLFGESAMLHRLPRNATIVAATPCSLYELSGDDLDQICESHPGIRKAVELVDAKRAAANTTLSSKPNGTT